MTGLVRKATLLAVCGLLTASAAMAHVPDPAHCTCPAGYIDVMGHNGVVGDPFGNFCVTVRDFNNVPIENSSVVIDFANCDLQLCVNQLDANVIVDCVSQTVRKLTNVNGQACFVVIGKARPALGCVGKPPGCVRIYADGVFLCNQTATEFDLINAADGSGVGAGDLANYITLFVCGTSPLRADYDHSGAVGAGDLARLITIIVGGKSANNCPPPKNNNTGPKCQ